MSEENETLLTEKSTDLRIRAEALLRERSFSPEEVSLLSNEEIQILINELQVHQIELEVQNEELRKAQLELTRLKDEYIDLYDFAPVGYLTVSDTGLIQKANLTAGRLLRVERGMLLKRPLSSFVAPEDHGQYYLNWSRLHQEPAPTIWNLSLIRSDAFSFDAEVKVEPIVVPNGDVRQFRLIVSDVSERNRAERRLQESEKRFRDLAELLPQGIFEADSDTKITFGNSALRRILSVSPDEDITGMCSTDMADPSEYSRLFEHIEAVKKGLSYEQEFIGRERNGIRGPDVLVKVVPIISDDHIVGFRGVVTDISSLKRAERERMALKEQFFQSQKLASLGTLVEGIAHDFNNMLQVVLGYTELVMNDRQLGPESRYFLESVVRTSVEGADLVSKLLAFAQQSRGTITTLDLNDQLRKLSTLVSRTLPNIVQLDLNLVDCKAMILGDKAELEQIVMNIAINASEAMSNGGNLSISSSIVSLDEAYCRSEIDAKPGDYVMLSIKDTGKGMDEKTLSQIFDPFFSTKERGATRGTGLGLSVVRGIILKRGGHITCESTLGEGTEFKAYFPLIKTPESPESGIQVSNPPSAEKTILLIEDKASVAGLEQRLLEGEGYGVVVAGNGREAVEIYKTRKDEISLVLLDLIMPQMSGRDCLRELLKINPSVDVLVVSGCSPEGFIHNEIRPLVRGFVHKPFSKAELLGEVNKVLHS